MFKPPLSFALLRPALMITILAVFFAIIGIQSQAPARSVNPNSINLLNRLTEAPLAQKTPQSVLGAPLKGVDVKLGKNPGANLGSRTTDSQGNFDFGVLPRGSYLIILALSDKLQGAQNPTARGDSNITACLITISGIVGEKISAGWDFEKNKAFDPTVSPAAAKASAQNKIIINTDGKHPVNGTIVKSKSNISNN